MPPNNSSPFRLNVEGPDDKHSVIALLKRHGTDWDGNADFLPFVQDAGGIEPLLSRDLVGASLKSCRRVGWVLDADTSPTNRWHKIREAFEEYEVRVPSEPQDGGTVLPGVLANSLVGVWLMPDNRSPGCLEDFVGKLVPPTCPCWPHAKESTKKATTLGSRLQAKDYSKGVIHAWLAWQEKPGLPFGTALTAQVLGHDSPESQQFVAWFKRLFLDSVTQPDLR